VTTAPLRRRRLWPREEAQENPLRLVQQRGGSLRERTELGPAVGDTDQCERQVQLQGDRVGRLAPARVGVTRVVRADQDAGRPRTTSPAQRVATKCARSRAGSAMAARSQSSIRNPPAARRLWGRRRGDCGAPRRHGWARGGAPAQGGRSPPCGGARRPEASPVPRGSPPGRPPCASSIGASRGRPGGGAGHSDCCAGRPAGRRRSAATAAGRRRCCRGVDRPGRAGRPRQRSQQDGGRARPAPGGIAGLRRRSATTPS
jgi:hypothetical protein